MTGRVKCICMDNPSPYSEMCGAEATQEDWLCDHCRHVKCETMPAEPSSYLIQQRHMGCPCSSEVVPF